MGPLIHPTSVQIGKTPCKRALVRARPNGVNIAVAAPDARCTAEKHVGQMPHGPGVLPTKSQTCTVTRVNGDSPARYESQLMIGRPSTVDQTGPSLGGDQDAGRDPDHHPDSNIEVHKMRLTLREIRPRYSSRWMLIQRPEQCVPRYPGEDIKRVAKLKRGKTQVKHS